jgi:hypothetical protein
MEIDMQFDIRKIKELGWYCRETARQPDVREGGMRYEDGRTQLPYM